MLKQNSLARVMNDYAGRIVRIGTYDGSAYFACGISDKWLVKDIETIEEYRKEYKEQNLIKMEREFADGKKNLPKLRKQEKKQFLILQELQIKDDLLTKETTETLERYENRKEHLKALIGNYLEIKQAENEKEIENLHGRAKGSARSKFNNWARDRRRKYNSKLRKWDEYQQEKNKQMIEAAAIATTELIKAKNVYDKLKKSADLAKSKVEGYPGRIRRLQKYLKNYTPFRDRPVIEIYNSTIKPGETSILIKGGEPGFFWDCREFDEWRRTGRFPNERGGDE